MRIALLLGCLAAALLTFEARAQELKKGCMVRADLVALLSLRYKETLTASGAILMKPQGIGGFLEIYTAVDGAWSFVVSFPNGVSCVHLVGEDWEDRRKHYD